MSEATMINRLDEEVAWRLLGQRTLVMGTELDEALTTRLCAGLLMLADDDPRADIRLLISSPGGSVPGMLAIHDLMRLIPNDVVTVAAGMAASAGQFLLSAGTPGKRFSLPHARILLHQGSAGIGGAAQDVAIQADNLRHTRDTVIGLIAADTGQPFELIERDSRRDRWFTAEAALAYGFIDAIVDSYAQIQPAAKRPMGLGRPPR